MAKKNAPAAPIVPLDLWRELYQAAVGFQLLAPWRWMDDSHVYGTNNEHGVRLVCVLGNMGEVFGLASYRGTAGANLLMGLRSGEIVPEGPDALFGQDALLVDFVPRKGLRKEDRAVIEQLDFQPPARKPKLFPEFQSHKPGYLPWFVDEAEVRLLLDDLQRAVRFAELLRTNPALFDSRQENEFPFLPASMGGPLTPDQLEWHTMLPAPPSVDVPVDTREVDLPALFALPQLPKAVWELTAFYSPTPVGEPPRPYFPKLALVVDSVTGIILESQFVGSQVTVTQAAARSLVNCMETVGCRPAAIRVDSSNLVQALQPLVSALGVEILEVKTLPMVNEARRALEAMGTMR